jgi:hypothetical protein
LKTAGLVVDRREGKWIEFALAERSANPHAGPVLALLGGALDRDPVVIADDKRRRAVLATPRAELCALTPTKTPRAGIAGRGRAKGDRFHA